MKRIFFWVLALTLSMDLFATSAEAQYRVLHYFNGDDGMNPTDLTLSSNGTTLYGTANSINGYGTIFSIPVSGGELTTLYNFGYNKMRGIFPNGGLALSPDGLTLYGTARGGGTNDGGTIFSIPVTGGTPTVLNNFVSHINSSFPNNGSLPAGGLKLIGSTLYGTTQYGGISPASDEYDYGYGTIFSIPVTGGTPTDLFQFNKTLGCYPTRNLTLIGSTFYGMTSLGGAFDKGTIFSIPVTGGTPTILYNFDGTHGSNPVGDLTFDGSTFYGTTTGGGSNNFGTIFSIPMSGGTPNILCNIDRQLDKTYYPSCDLTLSSDGKTLYGINCDGPNGYGSIFSIPVSGGPMKTLVAFDGANGGIANPWYGSLKLSGSTLYGAAIGGPNNLGVIFAYDLTPVPEPSTIALLLTAATLGGLLWWRRRR